MLRYKNNNTLSKAAPLRHIMWVPALPGVYEVYCNATNESYIGSSINLNRRVKEHCRNSFNAQKELGFFAEAGFQLKIRILYTYAETPEPEELLRREYSYIRLFRRRGLKLYNSRNYVEENILRKYPALEQPDNLELPEYEYEFCSIVGE